MDFSFTEEVQMLKNLARTFAEKEILPKRDEWNETGRFPIEIFKKMANIFLL